ncbi:MAG: maleylpyruvate isomerase family mycothiol-dependent enzyme [Micromonosporaceae bacterium]|nr:maleylpyruvate isomerase family mycothiol-dependent enzyme [Micromonosporaceae bacterium]
MGKSHGTKEFWLAALRTEAVAFAAAVSQDDTLALPVPSCPGWTMTDLVTHLGGVYSWVSNHVTRHVTSRPETTSSDFTPGATPLLEWWNATYSALLVTLEAIDADSPAWNWAPQSKKAIFWHRRMANETALRRWDAQMATGLAEPIEPRLAADGLAEAIDTHLAAGRGTTPSTRPGVVALQATDIDQIWYVRFRSGGIALLDTETLFDDDDHHERATASGTASDLMLAVYGRVPFEVLQVSGEVDLLTGLRTQ